MKLFDAHCHLQFPQYDADRAEVLARMQEKEMGALIVGTDLEKSRAGLELAKQYDFLWASVGLHPNDPDGKTSSSNGAGNIFAEFEKLARDPKIVAVGECGLDYFRSGGTPNERAVQQERFEKHIELALKLKKPLIVHCRDPKDAQALQSAHADLQQLLHVYKERFDERKVNVVIHFFTGSGEVAQKYLDLGCYLSFPGPVTYTDMYDDSIRIAPLDKILVETDAPFAAPVPHRGRRNEPAYVEEVVKKIAAVRAVPAEEIARQTVLNSQRIFGLQ